MSELARVERSGGLARGDVDVSQLLSRIVESGLTSDAAGAVKELALLQEHQQDRYARQQFIEAFARVRAKTRRINATKANPDKDGRVRWWMCDLQTLQDEVEPVLREEGMELSFDTRREGPNANIVIGICIIMHVASGHVERRECGVNAGNAQGGDLGAATTAKRGALIAALALRIQHDDNARMLGDTVSPEMVAELQGRARAVGADEKKLLAFAGATDWKNIRQGRLGQIHDFLRLKEKKQAEGVGGSTGTVPAPASSATPTPTPPVDAPAPDASAEQENATILANEYLDSLDAGGMMRYVEGLPPQVKADANRIAQITNIKTPADCRAVAFAAHVSQQLKR